MTERTVPVHDLLLALAGRLDDDLLAWARELLAVGEQDQAVELATAALAAERVALPGSLRTALVAAARAAHTDLDVENALSPEVAEPGTPHRFDAAAAPGNAVVAALTALPARRLAGCRLHLTWRRTPAGAAPGPGPRAVVLVEADPDRSPDVLAYLLATELDRAGAPASVEVFTTGTSLPAYHAAALHGAREVVSGEAGSTAVGGAVRGASTGREVESGGSGPGDIERGDIEPVGPVEVRSVAVGLGPDPGVEEGRTLPTPRHGVADPTSTPLFLVPSPDDVELARPEPDRRPPVMPDPAGPGLDDAPDTDPLNGPLRVPLLAPLLDPTGGYSGDPDSAGRDSAEQDPAGQDSAGRVLRAAEPEQAPPVPPEPGPPAEPEPAPPSPPGPSAPSAPAEPGPGDDPAEWEQDWRTGEWAMPRTRPATPDGPGSETAGFDAFGVAPVAGRDLPPRAERTGRRRRDPGSGAGSNPGSGAAAARPTPDDVSLFDSPTARVESGPPRFPSSPPKPERGPAGPPPTGPPDPGRPPGGPTPAGPSGTGVYPAGPPPAGPPAPSRPDTRSSGVPVGGEALFGPRVSDVPLFDRPPAPTDRPAAATGPPGAPSGDAPRPGRRRRPDGPPPGEREFPPPGEREMRPPGVGIPPGAPTGDRPIDRPAPPPYPDPEPSALLSGTERDLLAQLQADLAAQERRPRPYRRAGQNGAARVNGHGHTDGPDGERPPPNLAG